MHRIFKKDQILTIPNLLSLIRLLMIPTIVWLYCYEQRYYAAVVVVILSGLTDIADGIIARKFNMVSDFGKILDPAADKLTQITMIVCLATRYRKMWALVTIFIVKEFIMALLGFVAIKKLDEVSGAKWYGKVNTLLLYTVMGVLIMLPNISYNVANTLIVICGLSMIASALLYVRFYFELFKNAGKK